MTTGQDMTQSSEGSRWRGRDSLSTVIWALIFIWAGGVLLAGNLGYLGALQTRFADLPGPWASFGVGSWPLIFLGAGVLVAVEVAVRLAVPALRRPILGRIILAVVLIGVGLGPLTNWGVVWPAILIVVGASLLLRGFFRGR